MASNHNPFSQMLTAFDPKRIYGRDGEVAAILRGVTGRIANTIGLYGVKTIGKTTLLKLLCHPDTPSRYKDDFDSRVVLADLAFLYIYIDLYHVGGEDVVPTIYEVLKLHIDPRPVASEQDEDAVRRGLVRLCQEAAYQKQRLVICLDHFDRAFQGMPDQDDAILRHLANFHSFVVATEKRLDDLRDRSLFMNVTISRNIGLLSDEDARLLVTEPLELSQNGLLNPEDESSLIIEIAGRQPYLLALACEYLFEVRGEFPESLNRLRMKQNETYERLVLEMAGSVNVENTLAHFWKGLTDDGRTVLSEIAGVGEFRVKPKDLKRSDLFLTVVLSQLKSNALCTGNLQTGTYRLFSDLFRIYVLRQKPLRDSYRPENEEQLSRIERAVLSYLRERTGQPCEPEEIIESVWPNGSGSPRALQSAIYRIQAKLSSGKIENVYGQGYKYVPDDALAIQHRHKGAKL